MQGQSLRHILCHVLQGLCQHPWPRCLVPLNHCDIYSPFHPLPPHHISKAPSAVATHLPGEPLAQVNHSWPPLGCTQWPGEQNQGSVVKGPGGQTLGRETVMSYLPQGVEGSLSRSPLKPLIVEEEELGGCPIHEEVGGAMRGPGSSAKSQPHQSQSQSPAQ